MAAFINEISAILNGDMHVTIDNDSRWNGIFTSRSHDASHDYYIDCGTRRLPYTDGVHLNIAGAGIYRPIAIGDTLYIMLKIYSLYTKLEKL